MGCTSMAESMLGIYGDLGQLIIDDTFSNLQLVEKMSVSLATPTLPSWSIGTMIRDPIVISMANSMICAVELSENPVCVVCGKLLELTTDQYCSVFVPPKVTVDKMTYYLFGIRHQTGRFGLEVFNSFGECVFNANNNYMRVVHYETSTLKTEKLILTLPNYYRQRKYAVAFPSTTLQVEAPSGQAFFRRWGAHAYIHDGKVYAKFEIVHQHQKPFGLDVIDERFKYDIMVIDVTGL